MGEEYDKLVRDEIPEIIEANDETPVTHIADETEYERRLLDKLDEEVAEYSEEQSVEELADVLEVIHALREHHGITREELAQIKEEKASERGRFDDRIVLERVDP
jgi:predicted house-cleaning noncanonical NTP pyrophosphatase (MazG superfamily)